MIKNLYLPKQCLLKVKNLPYLQEPNSVIEVTRLPDLVSLTKKLSVVSTADFVCIIK